MAGCRCDTPTAYRATSENVDEQYLYLRCESCGGKAGRVSIDIDDLTETVTNPNELEGTGEDGGETARVSIHFDASDSPWMFD